MISVETMSLQCRKGAKLIKKRMFHARLNCNCEAQSLQWRSNSICGQFNPHGEFEITSYCDFVIDKAVMVIFLAFL